MKHHAMYWRNNDAKEHIVIQSHMCYNKNMEKVLLVHTRFKRLEKLRVKTE